MTWQNLQQNYMQQMLDLFVERRYFKFQNEIQFSFNSIMEQLKHPDSDSFCDRSVKSRRVNFFLKHSVYERRKTRTVKLYAVETSLRCTRKHWRWRFNPLMGTVKPHNNRPLHSNFSPLLAIPNVTAYPSTTSVPTSYYSMWRCNYLCPLDD